MTTARPKTSTLWLLAAASVVLVGALSLAVGRGDLADASLRETFLALRTNRLVAAFLTGTALSVAGVLVQGLFRNPLADPGVLGTTAGAVLGGKLTLYLLEIALSTGIFRYVAPEAAVPIGCMAGALAAMVLLLGFVRGDGDLLLVLLLGFSLSSLFASIGSFVTILAQEQWELGRALVAFALGSVSGAGPRHILFALPSIVGGAIAAFAWGRSLDVLLSGEDEARALGVDVRVVRRWCAVWVSVLTGAAVSIGGFLGFVGLVVPHVLRPYTGAEHRRLLPFAAVFGGVFVVLCDVVVRALPTRSEMPLGVMTGLVGAPLFLYLLLRQRREAYDG